MTMSTMCKRILFLYLREANRTYSNETWKIIEKKSIERHFSINVLWNPKQLRLQEEPPVLAPFCRHPRFVSPRMWILLLVADDRVVLWLEKISRARYVARNALQGNRNGRDTKVFPTDPCIVYWDTVSLVAFSLPENHINRVIYNCFNNHIYRSYNIIQKYIYNFSSLK